MGFVDVGVRHLQGVLVFFSKFSEFCDTSK